jgi:hypothetical protein
MARSIRWFLVTFVACGGRTVTLVGDDAGGGLVVDSSTNNTGPIVDAGPAPNWSSCSTTSECAVVPNTCCGTCGPPALYEVTSVNAAKASAFHASLCNPQSNCPECVGIKNAHLLTECRKQSCEAFDVRTSSYAACKTDDDCTLQHTSCCSCEPDDYVAVNKTFSSYIEAHDPVCAQKGCRPCPAPSFYHAHCSDSSFCSFSISLGGLE